MKKKILAFRPGHPDKDKDALGIIYNKESAEHMIHMLKTAIEKCANSDEFYISQNGTFIQP